VGIEQGLTATTRRLGQTPDLLPLAGVPDGIVWQSAGVALAGVGVAHRIDLPGGLGDADGLARAHAELAAIVADDEVRRPGTGAVALGALPFDPAAPGTLVVPRTLWGRDADGAWVTVVGAPGADPDPLPAPPSEATAPTAPAPDAFSLTPSMPQCEWQEVVAEAVTRIHAGALDKVVLARRVDVEANRPFLVAEVLGRLGVLYPSCMLFFVDGFLGASPELLVGRRGRSVESRPLAGTVARSGDTVSDDVLVARLMASDKERWEHRLVIDTLAAALAPLCEHLDVPERPEVLGLRNVSHLATVVRGSLLPADPLPSALDLVAAVHPTPAVGGIPTKEALAQLQATEGFDRGRYAGPVGWLDARGDGDFALGIRSATVDGAHASMYAGVGVVSGSEPAAELAETQLKLQALLAALVRP
jgi:menaquinone-specific isochorismate synthase